MVPESAKSAGHSSQVERSTNSLGGSDSGFRGLGFGVLLD